MNRAAARGVLISEVIDSRPIGGFQKSVVALCFLLAFVEGFDAQNAGFVAPGLAKAWSLDPAAIGLFFSLGLFGLALGAFFLAPLADRMGRKPVLLISVLLFGLASLGMAASTSVDMLFAFRFATGLGIGGAMPNAIAMTSEYSPRRSRSLTIVVMFNGFTTGSVAAGLAAAWVMHRFGWNSVFIIGGVMPLLLAPAIALWLPESVRFLASRPKTQGQVGLLMRRIDPAQDPAAFFILDDRPVARMSVVALFQDGRARASALLWLLVFCSLVDLYLMSSWLPTQIAAIGVSVGLAILISTLLQVGGVTGVLLGWLIDRAGPNRVLTGAYLVAAAAIAGIGLAGGHVVILALCVFAAGFGIIGGQTAANAVAAATYPTEIRSTGLGWYMGVGRIGSIVGPAAAGFLLSAGFSHRTVFLLAVVPAVIAAGAALALETSQ